MGPIGKLGYLSPARTIFMLCDVQEKFKAMNCFTEFCKNIRKVVSCEIVDPIEGETSSSFVSD